MAKSDTIQLRVDPQVKREADALFAELGMPTATAITLFLKTAIREGGIPFPIRTGPDFALPEEQNPSEEEDSRSARKKAKQARAASEKMAKESAAKAQRATQHKQPKEKTARKRKEEPVSAKPDGNSPA